MSNIIKSLKHKISDASSFKTKEEVNKQIEDNINYYSVESEAAIKDHINDLDAEWDVESAVELNVAIASFSGLILAAAFNKKWLVVPALAAGFLARYALRGGSERMHFGGLRSRREIAREKYGLQEVVKKGVKRVEQF